MFYFVIKDELIKDFCYNTNIFYLNIRRYFLKKIYFYQSYQDDIIENKKQNYQLKDNYQWLHFNLFYRLFAKLLYFGDLIFAFFYTKFFLHITVKNKKKLKKEKSYFLYCNHTQMLGDVFNPFLICFPHHPYLICSSSNLGIPFLGKLLPMAGALPIPNNIHDMIKFKEAINYRINSHPIIIYPEAHLWPYATFIRDFSDVSFHYPVENNQKVYVATTTYTKSKFFKKPKITIYIDGPFQADDKLTKKENMQMLHDKVYKTMVKRSKLNNYEYITYKKKD